MKEQKHISATNLGPHRSATLWDLFEAANLPRLGIPFYFRDVLDSSKFREVELQEGDEMTYFFKHLVICKQILVPMIWDVTGNDYETTVSLLNSRLGGGKIKIDPFGMPLVDSELKEETETGWNFVARKQDGTLNNLTVYKL